MSRYIQCDATDLDIQLVAGLHDRTVNRDLLSWYYGGSPQCVFSTISEEKRVSRGHQYEMFFCPHPAWNPDIPRTPGARGLYLTVRIDEFTREFPIFVRLGSREWLHVGNYKAIRTNPLMKEDWQCLPIRVGMRAELQASH